MHVTVTSEVRFPCNDFYTGYSNTGVNPGGHDPLELGKGWRGLNETLYPIMYRCMR